MLRSFTSPVRSSLQINTSYRIDQLYDNQKQFRLMAKKFLIPGALVLMAVAAYSFTLLHSETPAVATAQNDEKINWLSWEEAQELMAKEPKKMFIDLYTDWCGWCKRMDRETFTDPEVAKHINQHFYAVKFNAEQKEEINYKGHTMKFRGEGRRGAHELAISLLDGRLGYPSFVYLDENQDRITISPGYKTPDVLVKELRYIGGEHYKTTKFENFQ
jgi:thioredoxin-related protein